MGESVTFYKNVSAQRHSREGGNPVCVLRQLKRCSPLLKSETARQCGHWWAVRRRGTGFPPARICANLKWCKHAFAARHAFWAVPPNGGVQQPNCSLLRSGQARALTRGTAAPALKPSHATGKAHVGGPGAVVSLHQFACPTLAKSNPQGETRSA